MITGVLEGAGRYDEDLLALKRRQAAFWECDLNEAGEVRYPVNYKADNEEPHELDGDDHWGLNYRADYVLKSWAHEIDYTSQDDWDDEDWPL